MRKDNRHIVLKVLMMLIGQMMTVACLAGTGRADDIFRTGLESLALESWAIVAGPIAEYSKQVTSHSQDGSMALAWKVTGRLAQPFSLKGSIPANLDAFSREEEAFTWSIRPMPPDWQLMNYLQPNEMAVLFFRGDRSHPSVTVLPGGADPNNLVALLQDIISIQAILDKGQQKKAWLHYLQHAGFDEGRMVALRSLLHLFPTWPDLSPILERMMIASASNSRMKGFLFGIIAFAIMNEKFTDNHIEALDFLCRNFIVEKDSRIALSYILHMKFMLHFTTQEANRQHHLALKHRIVDALKRRAALEPLPPELAEQFKEIRAAYPKAF
jgi:hypothetical protein